MRQTGRRVEMPPSVTTKRPGANRRGVSRPQIPPTPAARRRRYGACQGRMAGRWPSLHTAARGMVWLFPARERIRFRRRGLETPRPGAPGRFVVADWGRLYRSVTILRRSARVHAAEAGYLPRRTRLCRNVLVSAAEPRYFARVVRVSAAMHRLPPQRAWLYRRGVSSAAMCSSSTAEVWYRAAQYTSLPQCNLPPQGGIGVRFLGTL